MLEASHERPEEVIEFSSHVDVKQRARALQRFKTGQGVFQPRPRSIVANLWVPL